MTEEDNRSETASAEEIRLRVDDDPLIGKVFSDRYKILSLLGAGGWGNVYLAEHVTLGSQVAVKVLHKHLSRHSDSHSRLEREAKLLSRIDSPFVVKTLDYGLTPQPYLVMEYFKGETLSSFLEKHQHSLPMEQCLSIFQQLCLGLSAAQEFGVVHRDLKPSNILVQDAAGAALKILDFGLVKISDDSEGAPQLTLTGEVMGSPPYMAPEQWAGRNITARTDIYALGCLMYEVLTGKPCFRADSSMQYMNEHLNTLPPKFSVVAQSRKIPHDIELVVLKCLQKRPEHRYGNAAEILDDLSKAKGGQKLNISIHKDRFVMVQRAKERRSPVFIALALTIVSLVGASALVYFNRDSLAKYMADQVLKGANQALAGGDKAGAEAGYRQVLMLTSILPVYDARRLQAGRAIIPLLKEKGALPEAQYYQEQIQHWIGMDQTAELLNMYKETMKAQDAGNLAKAEKLALKLIAYLEPRGKHTMVYASAIELLGSIYRTGGDMDRAIPLKQESTQITEELMPPNDPMIIERVNNLGLIYRIAGRYDEAVTAFERAIKMAQISGRGALPKIYNNLAGVYLKKGDNAASEPYFNLALEANREFHGGLGSNICNNWAVACLNQRKFDEAEKYLRQAIEEGKAEGATNVLTVSQPWINLGQMYKLTGRYAKAKECYDYALKMLSAQPVSAKTLQIVYDQLEDLKKIQAKNPLNN